MMAKPILIRPGSETDLDFFFDLYWISSLEHTHYTGTLDTLKAKEECKEYIIRRQQDLMKNPDNFFLVAEENMKIIGMITGHIGERDEAVIYSIELIGFVDEICVHPDYRNTGIGKQLLDNMLQALYDHGVDYIGVGVAFKNPAFHFYKSCGFSPEGMWMIQERGAFKK